MDFVAPGPSCSISKIRRIRLSGAALPVLTCFDHFSPFLTVFDPWKGKPMRRNHPNIHKHTQRVPFGDSLCTSVSSRSLICAMPCFCYACDTLGGSNWWWASSNRRSCRPSLRKKWRVSRRRMSAGSRGADAEDADGADTLNFTRKLDSCNTELVS